MLSIHWRAPLQAKGFLKIIEFFVAILAFSLVAGFSATETLKCNTGEETTNLQSLKTKYPFNSYALIDFSDGNTTTANFNNTIAPGAELFVAWGVLSMLYCIIAIAVYMLFTANESLEKVVDFLIYVDLAFHAAWVLCWFVASVTWAVSFNHLRGLVGNILDPDNSNIRVICNGSPELDRGQYAQAAIAVIFGFLSLFLWAANIYWVLIDTAIYIQWRAKRAASSF